MKNLFLFWLMILFSLVGYSQVGINTVTPNAQLEIKSSNQATPANTDGIIIPKIDTFPITNPTVAQQGMMIYLTTVSAGKPPGFYYWDNTITSWVGFNQNPDADFYKVGTTTAPNLITDDMFHTGNVGVGLNMPAEKLHIDGGNIKVGNNVWSTAADNRLIKFGDGNYVTIGEEIRDDFLSFKAQNFIFNPSLGGYDGKVGIGTTGIPDAKLHINASNQATPSSTDGILIPKIDTFPITNPTAAQNSMMVYLTTLSAGKPPGFYYWNNATTSWIGLLGNTSGWSLTGNAGTNPTTNFIGTTDVNPIIFRINNEPAGRIDPQFLTGSVFFGIRAGGTGTGLYNVGIGVGVLENNENGNHNTGIGLNALQYNKSGFWNTAIGANALSANDSGSNNVAIGYGSLMGNDTGINNTANGFFSLLENRVGNGNVGFGNNTLYSNRAGSNGIAIGKDAMYYANNTSTPFENRNIAIGFESLKGSVTPANNTGNYNTAIGYQTLTANVSGNNNTAIGISSLKNNTDGHYNVALGNNSLELNEIGNENTAIGSSSLVSNRSGNRNSAIGDLTLFSNVSGGDNVAVGRTALYDNVAGSRAVAIGHGAMAHANNTVTPFINQNVAVGYNALFGSVPSSNNTGNANIAIGYQTLYVNTSGSYNNAIGTSALLSNNKGNNNTAIGVNAATKNTNASQNIAIGANALQGQSFANGGIEWITNNVALGIEALYNNNPTSATNGRQNVALGNYALASNVTGSNNIAIGFQAGFSELGSNKLYIENSNSTSPLVYGEFDNDILKINGTLKVNKLAVDVNEMQINNSNLFVHAEGVQNFGAGLDEFIVSSRETSTETGGIYGDGNAISIWSAGDSNQGQPAALVYFLDEDFFDVTNTNPYDNNALRSYISPAGAYVQISDKNKKENIIKIENASDKISQINGYIYQFKLASSEIEKGDKPIKSSGVLAQELEKVLPEAVQKNDNGDYFVDYAAITPLLIEAIKEQNSKIKNLEKTNLEILKRLEKLENN